MCLSLKQKKKNKMGKITSDQPHQQTLKTHFSHSHPLSLIPYHHQQTLNSPSHSCSGCNLKPSGMIYSCTTCNYFLHKKCFEMPMKITHPFHKQHAFTLLAKPAYPGGLFNCDACGKIGKGFSYHCKPCGVDLHILCAIMPLSLTHVCHAHVLELKFESPYGTKHFSCDICKSHDGTSHWLYRCGPCGFDAHLQCARSAQHQHQHQQQNNINSTNFQTRAPPNFQQAAPMPYHPMVNNAVIGVPNPNFGVNVQNNNELLIREIHRMVSKNNAAMAQAMLAGGRGGYGGDRGVQQMTQLMSGFNNGGVGGFGGGPDIFQGLMGGGGGGGGGLDLQSLLGGGNGVDFLGGGGLDFVGGGGGGLDFLGGALGGFGF